MPNLMSRKHSESHATDRIGWLRATVLGANDGIVSTASLLLGVSAAAADRSGILTAGSAALVAGALSMAAGEYVSVSSQADAEKADLALERMELQHDPEYERQELIDIYRGRGLDERLATEVADQLTARNALEAHARDELNIHELSRARPLAAAVASACSFAAGAALPLAGALAAPTDWLTSVVAASSLIALALLGMLGAWTGGAPPVKAALRVTLLGALAMALTAGLGALLGLAI